MRVPVLVELRWLGRTRAASRTPAPRPQRALKEARSGHRAELTESNGCGLAIDSRDRAAFAQSKMLVESRGRSWRWDWEAGSEKAREAVSLLSRKFGPRESAANCARLLKKKRYRMGTVINSSFAQVFRTGQSSGSWAQLIEATFTGQVFSSWLSEDLFFIYRKWRVGL
jgi:hypothetical protein